MHGSGHGVLQDNREVEKWYLKAAEQQFADAQSGIGDIYLNGGHGVQQDYSEARKWYLEAAEQGHSRALCCLGDMCCKGYGAPQDYYKGEWVVSQEPLIMNLQMPSKN